MTTRRIPISQSHTYRIARADRTLDLRATLEAPRTTSKPTTELPKLSKNSTKPAAPRKPRISYTQLWRDFWRDIREFWQTSYGNVRLYLTPEEASRERLLFATSLLVVFTAAAGFLAVGQVVRLVHIGYAEKERLQTLPATFVDILANRRINELPQAFQAVDDFLTTLDAHVAPGRSSLYQQNSVLHDVDLVRQSIRSLSEAGKAMTPVLTAASTFLQDVQHLDGDGLRKKYGSLTTYMQLQWKVVKEQVYPHLAVARSSLEQIHTEKLPAQVRPTVELLRSQVQDATKLVERLDAHMPAILSLLGADTPRTYAILLQNSGEMRPTGGFIGSLAMVKFNDGWIEYIRFRDVYDVDGQIFEDVPPPPGIETISRAFHLRDSNYWPDFPTSAKQVAWFLDKDKGPGVDGIFAVSDELAVRLLRVTGPVGFEGVKIPVDADNFMPLMSFLVESKQDKDQPKSALFRFMEGFMPQLSTKFATSKEALPTLASAVEDRLLLAYSFDPNIQAFFEEAGLAGSMYNPSFESGSGTVMDFFMPVYLATGGNKSDRYIEQHLTHDTRVTDAGRVQDQVTLVRRHTWNGVEEERLRDLVRRAIGADISDRIMEILGAERNREYMRFFVPKGAILVGVEGIQRDQVKIMEDLGMTVFGFEMSVEVGKEKRVKLTYELPQLLEKSQDVSYFLVMQKQPGGDNLAVTKTMTPTSRAVVMADTAGYSVVEDDPKQMALDIRPQAISLHNIWHGGYLLRIQ